MERRLVALYFLAFPQGEVQVCTTDLLPSHLPSLTSAKESMSSAQTHREMSSNQLKNADWWLSQVFQFPNLKYSLFVCFPYYSFFFLV